MMKIGKETWLKPKNGLELILKVGKALWMLDPASFDLVRKQYYMCVSLKKNAIPKHVEETEIKEVIKR